MHTSLQKHVLQQPMSKDTHPSASKEGRAGRAERNPVQIWTSMSRWVFLRTPWAMDSGPDRRLKPAEGKAEVLED